MRGQRGSDRLPAILGLVKNCPKAPQSHPMAWLNEQSLPSLQVVVSDRAKEVSLSLRSTGLSMKAIPANAAEGRFLCLGASFAEIPGAP